MTIILKILKLFIIIYTIFAIIRLACFILNFIYYCLNGCTDKDIENSAVNHLAKTVSNGFFAVILYIIYKILPPLIQYLF